MYIETHTSTIGKDGNAVELALTFMKSLDVQAFPCGRRRSAIIDTDGNDRTTGDRYRLPFDPEARLNTEANNVKHSGLNGYTQTYLKDWNETTKQLTLSLAGYLFNIKLTDDYLSQNAFGNAIAESLGANSVTASYIYANILLEDVQLFQGEPKSYYTRVLRNQSNTDDPTDSIDLLKTAIATGTDTDAMKDKNNYYFSGLSFSIVPATNIEGARSEKILAKSDSVNQVVVSLRILDLVGDGEAAEWKIHQPAYLPFIEHGEIEDSIVVGDTLVRKNLTVNDDITVTTGDLTISEGSITVGDSATITNTTTTKDLKVANEAEIKLLEVTEYAQIEDLDVNTNIDTATLEATESIKAPVVNVTATLNVTKPEGEEGTAVANIDKAIINEAEITTAELESATITTRLIVSNPDYAANPSNPEAAPAELVADTAGIGALLAGTIGDEETPVDNIIASEASIGTLTASDINQKVGDDFYDVPVIFLKEQTEDSKTFYQLQISRVTKFDKSGNIIAN
jgi:hypothetical protein